MRIGILGPLEVLDGGRRIEVSGGRLRSLLIVLALEAGRVVSSERLIDDLWEADPPQGAPNALHSLVSRLRATLGNGRTSLESHPTGYRLAVGRSDVDAYRFEEAVVRARRLGEPRQVSHALREALSLWRGPALSDVAGAPFAEAPIVRLEGLRESAVEERIEAELVQGHYADVIPELEALVAADPLREPLTGRLMRALYGAGRQADALATYEQARRLLDERLGVTPSAELEAIYLAVLRHAPVEAGADRGVEVRTPPSGAGGGALDAAGVRERVSVRRDGAEGGPAEVDEAVRAGRADGEVRAVLPKADQPRTNLRTQLTSFVGRDGDLARVCKLLGENRLVTLIGPGGSGKTRLSVEAGARFLGQVSDGVWQVQLAPVSDPAEVPHAMLAALGLRESRMVGRKVGTEAVDPVDQLALILSERRVLLILDNCEHLIDTVAALADRLLAECPEVRVLATSREPLGIMGEALWPVEPLDLPAGDVGLAEALTFPAVRLLVERAVAVRPSFQVTEANVGAVVEICRALDGMPLAIELAAARFRVLGPEAIAARLGDRFRLFTAGSRTALPRHQTLRAVVEWSWELLGERERALWRGLTVFAGGATEQSVEEVCSGDLDVLMALVDKSLIIVSEDGRVRMLETIREYGLERLRADPDEEHRLRRAHAEHFLALADAWAPAMRGAGQITALRMLTSEHDNLHAALRWAAQAGETRLALRLIASLGWYWWLRGHRSEAADTVAAVLAEPGLPEDEITASALILASVTSFGGPRDMDVVHGWLARAYSIVSGLDPDVPLPPLLRLVGPFVKLFESEFEVANAGLTTLFDNSDPWLRGMARYMYGQGLINGGRAEEAEEHFEKALQGFQTVGERWGTTFTLVSLAEVRGWRGEFRQAVALCERAVDLMIELGSQNDIAQVYVQLAGQLWMDGDREGAGRVMDRAADLEYAGAIDAQAHLLFYQCRLARLEGRTAEAAAGLERVYRLVRERLSKPSQFHALVLGERAALAVDTGDLDAARSFLAEAIPLALGTRDSPVIAGMLSCRARLAQAMGEQARAAEHLGQAAAIMGVLDLSHPDVVASAGELRAALGAAFDRHYTGGLNQPREEILADLADLS